jgi:pyruvate ferredoxin oxidoreductase delta subunit
MSRKQNLADRMKLPWKRMPFGGIMLEAGSSVEYRTGDWRITEKPVIDQKKCVHCLLCWIFCPDVAIVRSEKQLNVDYTYCKGCGICAVECPVHAIIMVEEKK